MSDNQNIEARKRHHIELASRAQVTTKQQIKAFDYEPVFAAHPTRDSWAKEFTFASKKMHAPLWISSMTGGTGEARHINQNLARVCHQFGLGMGLGSIRPLLSSDDFFDDFNLRPIIGPEFPLFANLGICQLEELLEKNELSRLHKICERLAVDGLIVHLNVLQEFFQPEGDRLKRPPINIIKDFLDQTSLRIIVKEVGQGMGPASLSALMKLPLEAIEFGAFGGTNFSWLEMLRYEERKNVSARDLAFVGHTADEMVEYVNEILANESEILCHQFIISGGIHSMLHGWALINKCKGNAVIGRASAFLEHAEDLNKLTEFVEKELEVMAMANSFLRIK